MDICSVNLCGRDRHSRGLCNYHYNLYKKDGTIKTRRYGKNPKKCVIDGCVRTPVCHGLCSSHYSRVQKHGEDIEATPIREKHGLSHLPEYQIWKAMKGRCNNPNDRFYQRYGGRGISVCREWADSFNVFLSDVGRRPNNLFQIDRINNDGDYKPGNCRWVSSAENVRNNSHTKLNKESVAKIKRLINSGLKNSSIAKDFGVSSGAINAIKRGDTWRDI